MCGLCGAAALDGPLDPAIREALPAMTAAIRHRGPDAEGFHVEPSVVLGHRRLAIIDRAGGEQPMANEDGTCFIVFNGEVYNHASLRTELQARGHVFRSRCDTEAILHGYEEWSAEVVGRLEGMFAFAIWDRRRRELLLARDRLGKKPLFWAILGNALHFASELKCLRASPAWDGTLDASQLEGYLSLGYVLAPATIYARVRKLEPASWLRLRGGRLEGRRYWDVHRFDDDRRRPAAIRADLDALLAERVRERLESEVPLGAFLSGGIDSGLVVSYMAEALREPVETTSVGFADSRHNELGAAALTARRYRTRHHAALVEPRLDEVLDPIVGAFDEPFADSSAIPTYYVSAMARRHVTVALSGDGGDETFGGYDFRYVPHAVESAVRAILPAPVLRRGAGWLARRWPRSPALPKPLRIGTVLDNLQQDDATAYFVDLCFLKPGRVRRLLGREPLLDPRASAVFEAVTEPYRRCGSRDPVTRAQYADLQVYLPNDVLVKVDRMSMQHALEVRSPLLDRRIVEFAFRVPAAVRTPRLRAKHLLRRIARDRLPPPLLRLPKHGFSAPIGAWIAGPGAEAFQDEVLGPGAATAALVDGRFVRALFDAHRTGRSDESYALWAVWILERWARRDRERAGTASTRVPR